MLQRALLLVFLVKSSQGAGLGKCGTDDTCNRIGLDYWGNDITHFPIESAAACACRCETYGDECQAWAFSPNNKYCWLKSRKSQPRVNRDRISGSKVCTGAPFKARTARTQWNYNPMTFWTLLPGPNSIGPAELAISKEESRKLVESFASTTLESNKATVSSTVEVGGVVKAFSGSASITAGYEHFTETKSSKETSKEKDMANKIRTTFQIEKGSWGLVMAEMKMFVYQLGSGKIERLIIPTGQTFAGSMNKQTLKNHILDDGFTSPARQFNLTTYTHKEMQDLIALSNYLPKVPTFRRVIEDGPFGGHGGPKGDGWSDQGGTHLRFPTGVEIRSGWYLDGLKMKYGSGQERAWHGGHGGGHQTCSWDPSDRVVRVKGRQGWYIDSIQFETRNGVVCGPYGGGGGGTWEAVARPGCVLNFLSGTSAKNRIASLKIHWACFDDL